MCSTSCTTSCAGAHGPEDLNGLRNNVPYLDALDAEMIPSPTAAGDFMRRFREADVVGLMEALNAVRPQLWKGRSRDLLGPVAYVDVDGTVAPTQGEKKAGMDMSYKGVWGYHPLVTSLANTGEVLYLVNRPGNVPSQTGAGEWIDRSIDLVAPHVKRVCVRGDTAFSLTAHFDEWSKKADFIFGYKSNPTLEMVVNVLDEEEWKPLERQPRRASRSGQTRAKRPNEKDRIVRERGYENLTLNCEHVAELKYRPAKCSKKYRMVVVRKNISRTKGENALIDEIRYYYYITTRTDVSAEEVVRLANLRCDQENLIAQLKSGVDAMRAPTHELVSNWAYIGNRDAGVEPEVLVRPDDAPQGRSPTLRRHGVPHVHPRDDPASLPGHPPGAADNVADHRVAALCRQVVQRLGRDRADRLRVVPPRTPRPTLQRYAHSRHRCLRAPGNAPQGPRERPGNTPSAQADPASASSRTADHLKSAHLTANTMPRNPMRLFKS